MLGGIAYVAALHARPAEMRAYEELPAQAKNRILPVVSARPWLNSATLARLWERLSKAVGDRQFALDLDFTRRGRNSDRVANREFDALFDPVDGFSTYYNTVSQTPFAIPTVRKDGNRLAWIERQFDHIDAVGRGAIVRVTPSTLGLDEVLAFVRDQSPENITFMVDCEWSRDVLLRAAWASGVVARIANEIDEQEIIVCGSSFPDAFRNIGERGTFPIEERILFDEVRRQNNRANVHYGDWASTRPPQDPTPMTNVPRIDISRPGEWVSIRQTEDLVGYPAIARRALDDIAWPAGLGAWGNYVVETTADELPGGIRTPATASAARINMHMHQQLATETPGGQIETAEPYLD